MRASHARHRLHPARLGEALIVAGDPYADTTLARWLGDQGRIGETPAFTSLRGSTPRLNSLVLAARLNSSSLT